MGARAASSDPPPNSSMLAINSTFVGNRLMRNAVAGIMIPMASEKPLVSHWPALAVTLNSLIISGSAVVNAVWSRDEISVPISNTAKVRFLSLGVDVFVIFLAPFFLSVPPAALAKYQCRRTADD